MDQPNGPFTRFQISFQGKVFIRNSNSSIPTTQPNHYKFSINFSGHVADLVGFFLPSLIWNSAFRDQCHAFPNFSLKQKISLSTRFFMPSLVDVQSFTKIHFKLMKSLPNLPIFTRKCMPGGQSLNWSTEVVFWVYEKYKHC